MTTLISICRGCSRPITILRNSPQILRSSNRPVKVPVSSWSQTTSAPIARRLFSTQKDGVNKPPGRQILKRDNEAIKNLAKDLDRPLLGYAEKLAAKSTPTTLYEAAPQRMFLFSSYTASFCCISAAAINIILNVYNVPEGLHPAVPFAFGAMGLAMAYIGTRLALMPAGIIRSIKVVPAPRIRVKPGAAPTVAVPVPVRLEILARRSYPFPGAPLRRLEVDPNDVLMKAPMYNRSAPPTEHEKVLMKEAQEAKRKKEREYEMNHLMTAPFRHTRKAFSTLFKNFRRGLTGEGFAPIVINGTNYKLDITSAYALENGRALDRIVRIEFDPALSRLVAEKKNRFQ
ncbi:hypothetical protein F4804DRAFT_51993 [Jackrogersella minutella]|nr:hypothetical protein F4804DRAFT_51993 [Jackrogersella minutella]